MCEEAPTFIPFYLSMETASVQNALFTFHNSIYVEHYMMGEVQNLSTPIHCFGHAL
jgi:hypothetical protein